MQELINVHCHLLNFEFVPDSFLKARAPVREWMLRYRPTGWIARGATRLWPGKKYDRLHQALEILNERIGVVAERLVAEMRDANIVMSTPLMMDLEIASFNQKPELPYRYQVELISEIAVKYAGRLMPFIMFDPRRRSASDLVIDALNEYGFLGVKMYPPLGYHPDPGSFFNAKEVNDELDKVYNYCAEYSIPITTHCSTGGAYSGDLRNHKELAQELCQPAGWRGVLQKFKDKNLYINFAHFGGSKDFLTINNPASWSHKIKELMNEYDHVYADVSYHDDALEGKDLVKYFGILHGLVNQDIVKDRIIFGTDWLMTRHTWTEQEYAEGFRNGLSTALQGIGFDNPMSFLFPEKKFPQRIKKFLKSKTISEADLPDWMRNNLTNLP